MALKYTTWKVTDEKELKLRLTSHQAATVEEKIGMNLLKIFMPEAGEEFTLPPLKVMLLLVHGALQQRQKSLSRLQQELQRPQHGHSMELLRY